MSVDVLNVIEGCFFFRVSVPLERSLWCHGRIDILIVYFIFLFQKLFTLFFFFFEYFKILTDARVFSFLNRFEGEDI